MSFYKIKVNNRQRDDEDDNGDEMDSVADIYLYEDVGESYFGESKSAKQFKDELHALGNIKQINLRINSMGGSVFDGLAMYNILRQNKAKVVTKIDGLAASIASVVAMSGDEIEIADTGMMMIHDAWTQCVGNAEQMREAADLLDTITVNIANTYKRSKIKFNDIRELMKAETWMTAEDCVKMGFADKIVPANNAKAYAQASGKFKFEYKNTPKIVQAKKSETLRARIAVESEFAKSIKR